METVVSPSMGTFVSLAPAGKSPPTFARIGFSPPLEMSSRTVPSGLLEKALKSWPNQFRGRPPSLSGLAVNGPMPRLSIAGITPSGGKEGRGCGEREGVEEEALLKGELEGVAEGELDALVNAELEGEREYEGESDGVLDEEGEL